MHANHIMLMGRMLLVRGEESLDAEEAEWASAVEEPSAASHSTTSLSISSISSRILSRILVWPTIFRRSSSLWWCRARAHWDSLERILLMYKYCWGMVMYGDMLLSGGWEVANEVGEGKNNFNTLKNFKLSSRPLTLTWSPVYIYIYMCGCVCVFMTLLLYINIVRVFVNMHVHYAAVMLLFDRGWKGRLRKFWSDNAVSTNTLKDKFATTSSTGRFLRERFKVFRF